jgi:hypothetical protein
LIGAGNGPCSRLLNEQSLCPPTYKTAVVEITLRTKGQWDVPRFLVLWKKERGVDMRHACATTRARGCRQDTIALDVKEILNQLQ